MEVRALLPQPFFFGSQALTVKPPPLKRQNSEHYRGGPPNFLARWRSSERSSLIRRRSRVRIPLEPPFFRSVAEQQMQRAVNALSLPGYEGASPSASTT